MTNKFQQNHPLVNIKPTTPVTALKAQQSPHYLQEKSSWQQRWRAVLEECSDCFIRF